MWGSGSGGKERLKLLVNTGGTTSLTPFDSPAASFQQAIADLQRSHAEIRYPDVILLIQEKILRFQVSVTEHRWRRRATSGLTFLNAYNQTHITAVASHATVSIR